MTAKELIDLLKECDPESEVCIDASFSYRLYSMDYRPDDEYNKIIEADFDDYLTITGVREHIDKFNIGSVHIYATY